MGFLKDLAVGAKAESLVQSTFQKHGIEVVAPKATGIKYDLEAILPTQKVLLEVKFDLFCARSGNIAIEFFNPKQGEVSGIHATQADLWAHVITKPLSVWLAGVGALRQFLQTTPPLRTVSCGGDDNSSMFLYKQEVIFDAVFTRVDECDTTEFNSVLARLIGV